MRVHHTKNKEGLAILKVKLDLYNRGWLILVPESDYEPFDIVAHKNDLFKRIQVKHRKVNKNGCIEVPSSTVHNSKYGSHRKEYDANAFDWYGMYCPETDLCYYVDLKEVSKSITLRIDERIGVGGRKTRWSKDYINTPL